MVGVRHARPGPFSKTGFVRLVTVRVKPAKIRGAVRNVQKVREDCPLDVKTSYAMSARDQHFWRGKFVKVACLCVRSVATEGAVTNAKIPMQSVEINSVFLPNVKSANISTKVKMPESAESVFPGVLLVARPT